MRVLDVGCGIRKYPGSIGIDVNPASAADVICDLDRFPYPFADRSFDQLRAIHVIEHLTDVIRSMQEFHRLVRAGGCGLKRRTTPISVLSATRRTSIT
jgi:predicted SAM-dependent methyltransferase